MGLGSTRNRGTDTDKQTDTQVQIGNVKKVKSSENIRRDRHRHVLTQTSAYKHTDRQTDRYCQIKEKKTSVVKRIRETDKGR